MRISILDKEYRSELIVYIRILNSNGNIILTQQAVEWGSNTGVYYIDFSVGKGSGDFLVLVAVQGEAWRDARHITLYKGQLIKW